MFIFLGLVGSFTLFIDLFNLVLVLIYLLKFSFSLLVKIEIHELDNILRDFL